MVTLLRCRLMAVHRSHIAARHGSLPPVTMLIPDARRGLLGGLVDDASLLRDSTPKVESAVDAYRMLRGGTHGWMVGRLVVPVSLLEDLAGVLVRTMAAGDSPIPIVAVFDGRAASDASNASAFHATMDPAARIEVVRLAAGSGRSADTVVEAANATRGIHHDVLPMMIISPTESAAPIVAAIGAAKEAVLHAVGAVLDLAPDTTNVSRLASSIRVCVEAMVPLTIQAEWFPASTLIDRSSGRVGVGAMNLLAAILQTEATPAETASTLSDDEPGVHAIGFGGLIRRGTTIRTGRSIGTDRSPLLSLSALEPAATLGALGGLDLSA